MVRKNVLLERAHLISFENTKHNLIRKLCRFCSRAILLDHLIGNVCCSRKMKVRNNGG